ncbi:hypothetical protein UFOVP1204_24 [uncultured Caudovirales phage]|uniref:Intramolecular chaperone auto-processing domain containing protein n=1 Tax=uncultured Caudovirales phage TaxID=2100421 RepID=A0A6J5RB40_9CAUD|nr:hypothetical protein UFOVP473_3 [uncultured Caudovirales phage]CAB4176126.1 hypothetical protein UFOVP983_3 [uncultured Caudovirales phage]CAB4189775.1 hypothetical protein UFOVP1204_24 [uncultured Caudovirales phage]
MSVSDFLFNGSPPPSVTTYGSSTANLPTWYSDYLQSILANGNAVAGEEYQPYGGPRVADFTQDQQNAFQSIRSGQGQYSPYVSGAINDTQTAASMSPIASAQPYLNQASQTAPDVIGNYMNPYTEQVTNRIGDLAARNLNEKLMPAIGDTFARAGQFGGSRQQEVTGRALRDTQESALAAQQQALQQGYGQAMTASQADLSRLGNLGQVAGNLTSAGQQNLTNAATAQSNIATNGQNMALKDAAALGDIGSQQQQNAQQNLGTAYSDFVEQRDYPKTQLGFMSNLARGFQIPTSTSTATTAPSQIPTTSGLSALAGGLGGIASLLGSNGKARGGRVTSPKRKPQTMGALALARR